MAQGTYTVSTEPQQGRTYENKKGGGNLTVWRLGLQDAESKADDSLFELHKKEGGRPPGVGDTIEVERFIEGEFSGEGFTRIKQVYNAAPSSGGGGQDSKNFDRRPEHPRNESRMIHTSALSAATGYMSSALAFGAVDGETLQPTDKWDAYWKLVGKVATKLTRSYEAAMEPQQQLPVAGGEVPADVEGLEPAAAAAVPDDKIPF